jgi:hypothetical protein
MLIGLVSDIMVWRTGGIYLHLLAACLALGTVISEDIAILMSRRIDVLRMESTMRTIKYSLIALWISGTFVVWVDCQGDFSLILEKPKLMAKLTVVALLTINGAALHTLVFPNIMNGLKRTADFAAICAVLAGISSVSWFFAAFLGIAKPLEAHLGLQGFVALFGFAIAGAIIIAMAHMRFIVEEIINAEPGLAVGRLTSRGIHNVRRQLNARMRGVAESIERFGQGLQARFMDEEQRTA